MTQMTQLSTQNGSRIDRPQIQVNNRCFDSVLEDAWEAIRVATRTPRLFQHEDKAVVLIEGSPERGGAFIAPARQPSVRDCLSRAASWVKVTSRGSTGVFVPAPVTSLVRGMPSHLPILRNIVHTPVFGSSGRILTERGYHAEDCLWLDVPTDTTALRIPSHPSPEDLSHARQLIEQELLGDFPFADQTDRAHAIAALLLPFVRCLVDGQSPYHFVHANMPGLGRSLLVDLVQIIASGMMIFRGQFALQVPELREYGLRGPGAMRWASGIQIRLACEGKPEGLRTFRHSNLRQWTMDHRNQLIEAALVLVQNWIVLGRLGGISRLHLYGFERWNDVVGGILQAAGIEGFLEGYDRLVKGPASFTKIVKQKSDEPDTSDAVLANLIAGWEELQGTLSVRYCSAANAIKALSEDTEAKKYGRLRSALNSQLWPSTGNRPTSRMLGALLKRFRGQQVGGRKLEKRVLNGDNMWFVRRVAD
jgi:hypothetical protein